MSMNIDPNAPSGAVSPSGEDSDFIAGGTSFSAFSTDSMGTAEGNFSLSLGPFPILQGPSILSFSSQIIQTQNAAAAQGWLDEQANAVIFSQFYKAALGEADNLLALYDKIKSIVYQQSALTFLLLGATIPADPTGYNAFVKPNDINQTNTMRNAITTYNNAVAVHIQAVNTYNAAVAVYATATNTFNTAQGVFNTALATYTAATAAFNAGTITQAQYDAATSTYNTALATYNTAAGVYTTATNVFNAAQAAYNAANVTYNNARTAYNNALTTYNTYANNVTGARNSIGNSIPTINNALNDWNAQLPARNTHINFINTQITSSGLDIPLLLNESAAFSNRIPYPMINGPALPPPDVTVAQMAPFPTGDFPTLAPSNRLINNPAALTQEYFSKIAGPLAVIALLMNNILRDIQRSFSFFDFTAEQGGAGTRIPAAYIKPAPRVFMGTGDTGIGAGSGVSLATIIASLSNKLLPDTLAVGIYTAQGPHASSKPLNPAFLNAYSKFNTEFLQDASLLSSLTAASILNGKLTTLDEKSPTLNVVVALAFANQIIAASNTNDIENSILELLKKANPDADVKDLQTLASQLATNTTLFSLEVALSSIGQALGLPSLVANILSGSPIATQLIETNIPQEPNTREILSNPISLIFFKTALAESLNGLNELGTEKNQTLINDAVNDVLANAEITDEESVRTALLDALIKQGIADNEALAIANFARDFIKEEIRANYRLETGLTVADINQSNLINSLTALPVPINTQIAQEAVAALRFNQDIISQRELRDRLSAELIKKGVNETDALRAATQVVLDNIKITPPVSSGNLQTDIANRVRNLLAPELDPANLTLVSNQLISTIFGTRAVVGTPGTSAANNEETLIEESIAASEMQDAAQLEDSNSLINKLDQVLAEMNEIINKATDTKLFSDALNENQRNFLKPTLNLYKFNQTLLDPANNIVMSMWTGIMYQKPIPTNWIKYLDFLA